MSGKQVATLIRFGSPPWPVDSEDAKGCNQDLCGAPSWTLDTDDAEGRRHDVFGAAPWKLHRGDAVVWPVFRLPPLMPLPEEAAGRHHAGSPAHAGPVVAVAGGCVHAGVVAKGTGSTLETGDPVAVALGCSQFFSLKCGEDEATLAVGLGWSHAMDGGTPWVQAHKRPHLSGIGKMDLHSLPLSLSLLLPPFRLSTSFHAVIFLIAWSRAHTLESVC